MPTDLLVSIFENLPLSDLVIAVPLVCKWWRAATLDRRCWRRIDLRDWDNLCIRYIRYRRDFIVPSFARFLSFVVDRSGGLLESVDFPSFANGAHLLSIADKCPKLLYFSLHNSKVDENKFCEAVDKLQSLRGMAIEVSLIRADVLNHVNSSHLSELQVFTVYINEEIASTVCKYLPHLKKLVLKGCTISAQAMIIFLDGLNLLEHLDILQYETSAAINDVILQKVSRLKHFRNSDDHWEYPGMMSCSIFDQEPPISILEFWMEYGTGWPVIPLQHTMHGDRAF